MTFENTLAGRTSRMGASAIREILKVVKQPGMISLAGGLPAPESFPMEIISDLSMQVIEKYGPRAFQYDLSEGFIPLREALVEYFQDMGIESSVEEIIISSGSQGALDTLGKILIGPGEKIAVEAPTYLGALQAFNPYEPEYVRIEMDEDGVIPESLEDILKNNIIKFVYLVPTFQNPTGRTTTMERRVKICEIIQKYNTLLIEDDPYSALRFRGSPLPPIKALAPDHVVYLGTFSKVLSPGLRVGFVVAPELIRDWMILVKQGVDLHTSTFNQALAAEYLAGGYLKSHLPRIIELYRPRQLAMLHAVDQYFPDCFSWSKPEGGMFIWAEGPAGMNLDPLYYQAVAQKAAFVPGKHFYADEGEGLETMRLNFTMASETAITKAVEIIGDVIHQAL